MFMQESDWILENTMINSDLTRKIPDQRKKWVLETQSAVNNILCYTQTFYLLLFFTLGLCT